ncbi:MAG: hypothetical protein ACP5G2_01160 [Candidatus Bipolaricaulaceae bacterium]
MPHAAPSPFLGIGLWALLVRQGRAWGHLYALELPAGFEWQLSGGECLELGAVIHYFLAVRWTPDTTFNYRFLALPELGYKWSW